jgi:hypothetical protein
LHFFAKNQQAQGFGAAFSIVNGGICQGKPHKQSFARVIK